MAAGLIDVPRVDAGSVDFGDGPGDGMFSNANGEFPAAFRSKFFRIIKADDAAFWIEDNGSGYNGAEQGTAASFVNAGDARPAELARGSLKTGRAETGHFRRRF